MFICPADWTMFQVPNGLDFTSLKNNRGEAVKSTIEKLEVMKEFREGELLNLLNKQYSGMQLKEPRKVKENSVVLIRNIANESKREPMKFARILKINDSRDEAQRILTLTYTNIKKRKDGTWIGTPITVERSINDVIPVDNALNESMLNPGILVNEENTSNSETDNNANNDENDEIADNDENNELTGNNDGGDNNDENDKNNVTNSNIGENTDGNEKEISTIQEIKDGNKHIRKSERIRKQRYEIHPDDIGNNDDEKDKNYKQ